MNTSRSIFGRILIDFDSNFGDVNSGSLWWKFGQFLVEFWPGFDQFLVVLMKRFRVNFWFRFDEPIFVLIWIKYWRHWKNQFFGLIFDWFLVNRFRLNSSLTESNQFWSIQAPILTNFWLIDAIRSWSVELNISPIFNQFLAEWFRFSISF